MDHMIVHFPMGAGGNFIKNIISLAPNYEMLNATREVVDEHDKAGFMSWYYSQPVTADTWLVREWEIRTGLYARYYVNNKITYWNPDRFIVYDTHGVSEDELAHNLLHWDRYKVDTGIIKEQVSPWEAIDCIHICINVADIGLINKIYNSKNPLINQFNTLPTLQERIIAFSETNNTSYNKVLALQNTHQTLQLLAEDLLTSPDSTISLIKTLGLNIDVDLIASLHSQWLQSTKEVYYNYYKEHLPI